MKAETQMQLERIRKVSRVVKAVCRILIGLTLIAFLVLVVAIIIASGGGSFYMVGTKIPKSQLTTGIRVVLITFFGLFGAVEIKGLYHLYKLFGNYAEGKIFTSESVAEIKQFGVTFLLWAGIHILALPFAFVLSLVLEEGGEFSFTFPFNALIMGGLIILISWVMDTGRGLREENELTI